MNGVGMPGISLDLETYDSTRLATLLSERNEMAIAAMLWDLFDTSNEPRLVGGTPTPPTDRVSLGHRVIQEVYTDPFFESNGDLFDDTCTSFVYLWSWLNLRKPTDPATAETVQKNIGRANPFAGGNPRPAATTAAAGDVAQGVALSSAQYRPEDFRWWRQLTMIVDNSPSMADNGKLDAVKTLMTEQVNDVVALDPKGVEVSLYTFDNTSTALNTVLEGLFFPDGITPAINGLTTIPGFDFGCQVDALQALAQAVANKRGGQAWVYTDGDTYQNPSPPAIRRLLNERQVRASFALLGGCSSPARTPADVSGEELTYLQLAADGSQPAGIVPYLLTALGSGGQFLFVNPDQLGNAADILRAQLANSAGAGRWSDYVSDRFTYRWDRLLPWEYQWFPAESLGQDAGQLYSGQWLRVDLPLPFSFYGAATSTVTVSEDGVIRMNPCFSPLCNSLQISRHYLDILDTDMTWVYIQPPPRTNAPAGLQQPAQYGPQVHVYTAGLGINEWYIISTQGMASYGSGDQAPRAYQVWLNFRTGEIRFQYYRVRNEAATAEIGLQRTFLFPTTREDKLLVSNRDANGAYNGMGYKFVPAPPRPTKTYAVAVDPLIEAVGFLLTGYSGDFEPLNVTYPDGSPVNCNDVANVLCLTLNSQPNDRKVQYVQANVNGRTGTWHATVDAGPSGQGTFTFTALTIGDLRVESPSNRLMASAGRAVLLANLGRTADGGMLTGWLQQPNGALFGSEFALYDDGAHGDGLPNDGLFGLPNFTPPGTGAGYLWVRGRIDGTEFVRSDPVPFNFQPFRLTVQETDVASDNDLPVQLHVTLENLDGVPHCYDPDVQVPDTWSYAWDFDLLGCLWVGASGSRTQILTIYPAWYHASSGDQARIAVAFTESELGAISDSAAVTFSRRRAPAFITFDNRSQHTYLRPNGSDTVPLTVIVSDEEGVNVADGTPVRISTSLGRVTPTQGMTRAGRLVVMFTAGTETGDALVTAQTGSLSATTTVHIATTLPARIEMTVTPADLSGGVHTASVVVTVRDGWGEPLAGQPVRIGVDGDGEAGTLNGSEVISGMTDAGGQVRATFTKGPHAFGIALLRAELLVRENGVYRAAHEARSEIRLGDAPSAWRAYLPLVTR
ncbi:MAG: Ig-like domain-containing protein [Caldilineales bacterium]|nr:Ig-like domain-containing protein [Caldilineales bacterium]